MNHKTIKLVLGLMLAATAGVWFVWKKDRLNGSTQTRVARTDGQSNAVLNQEIARRFLELETRRNDLDRTVWAKELEAERHEWVFIQLWDQLRTNANPAAILGAFNFGELLLGTPVQPTTNAHRIKLTRFSSPIQRLVPETWRQLVAGLERQGLRLEQSEWRHARFSINTRGADESLFAISLHALNTNQEERFVVRGELQVTWRKPERADPRSAHSDQAAGNPDAYLNSDPVPESINAANLQMLSRVGETPFEHRMVADITPSPPEPRFLEPSLQLHDLDGDGRSEIILPRLNRVFWNQGQGQFKPGQLFAHPPRLGKSEIRNPKSELVQSLVALNTGVIADFDGDGRADYLGVDAQGLLLFGGDGQGRFPDAGKRIRFTNQELANPSVVTAGDIDRDGDLDIWLGQYKVPYQGGQVPTPYYDANDGHPAFLLVNDGRGNFRDQTESAGLAAKRFRRTYSSSFVDLDDDGDLDLLVISDFAGADVYVNDGQGRFTDATQFMIQERHAFGMAHTFGDYDLDGHLDFLMIGMNSSAANRMDYSNLGPSGFQQYHAMRPGMAYGNRLYSGRNSGYRQTSLSDQVARSGWSWGATTGDFDNDGDPDIYVANGHISGQSVRDYETQFWRHDIYAGASKDDPALELYFRSVQSRYHGAGLSYGGFEKNRLFLNLAGGSFLEAGYLMGVSLEEDCRNAVSDDLDGDGKLELLVTTFQVWPTTRQQLRLFPNFTSETGNWIGVRLRESGPGFSPVGAKVLLTTSSGTQIRHFVTGDSYRSQHANTAHFGLGKASQVTQIEIVWPNGKRRSLLNPAINQYHFIAPAGAE